MNKSDSEASLPVTKKQVTTQPKSVRGKVVWYQGTILSHWMENKIDLRIIILGLVIYQRTKQVNLQKLQRKMIAFSSSEPGCG